MSTEGHIPIERLRLVADELTKKVSRSRLQECLVEAKLFSRASAREELRKITSKPNGWAEFVFERYQMPETRGAAQRALALLSEAYVKLPQLDSRVDTAFHKAHQAAERGDITRLQREITRLRELGADLSFPELANSDVILWMWAGTPGARDRIAEFLDSSSSESEQAKTYDHLEGSIEIQQQPSKAVPAPLHVALKPIPAVRTSLADTPNFVTELTSLATASPRAEHRDWKLDDVRDLIQFPAKQVDWPDSPQLVNAVQQLVRKLHETEFEAELSTPAVLYAGKKSLDECAQLVSEIQLLLASMSDALVLARKRAKAALETACSEDAAQARELIQNIEAESCGAEELGRAAVLVAQNYAAFCTKVDEALAAAKEIQSTACDLDVEACEPIREEVRALLTRVDLPMLQDLLRTTEAKARERAAAFNLVRSAAEAVLRILHDAGNPPLPVHIQEACRAAVNGGDGLLAVSIIRHHVQPSMPPRPHPAAAAISPQVEMLLQASAKAGRLHAAAAGTSRQAIGTGTYLPASEVDAVPAVPGEFRIELGTFTPRNRLTAKNAPNTPQEIMSLLKKRAIEEMSRSSILGVTEHALDILMLAGRAEHGGEVFANVGLALLSAPPPNLTAVRGWGASLAEAVEQSLSEAMPLKLWIGRLFRQPGFDSAIAERLLHREVRPFATLLATELVNAARDYSAFVLEDLFRAVGYGARYGDAETAREVLQQLASAGGASRSVAQKIRQAFESIELDPARATIPRFAGFDAVTEGLAAFRAAQKELRELSASRRIRGVNPVNVQVPPSVGLSGGFKLAPGSESLDLALLVSSPQGKVFSATELLIARSRNVPWLAEDTDFTLGPLDPDARLLIPLELPLHPDWKHETPVKLDYELRYIEARTGETKSVDGRLMVNLREAGGPSIDNYEGASGQPLVLTGDKLKLSSASVKDALRDIQNGLNTGNHVAALVIGRRRRGKTSILQTIANDPEIRKRYVILSDSVEDVPFRTATEVLGHFGNVFDRLARQLNVKVPSLAEGLTAQPHRGWDVVQEWLEEVNRSLKSTIRVLLLIDEFQKWISLLQPETRTRLLAILRGVMNRPATDNLSTSIVLFGLSNIRQYTKSSADFTNAFQVFEVKAFDVKEADALVRSNQTIEYDTRAVVRIRDLSGGNPFLINLLGNDIAARLREHGRVYCFQDDVERVVRSQLEDIQNSRVWRFLQYLLKQGEEDHAPQIEELPVLAAVAYTLRSRGARRTRISIEEVIEAMSDAGSECDRETLSRYLEEAVSDELLIQDGQHYSFASGWLAEWLAATFGNQPLPISKRKDTDLILNRYRVVELKAQGAQGTAYEAEDTMRFDMRVILKIYPRTQTEGISSIVEREAKALCAIEHNGVVRCFDYGTDAQKGDVLVLEKVKGLTLRELLKDRPKSATTLIGSMGHLSTQVKLIEQLAAALCECHRAGVVHKDLKPENIIIEQSAGLWLPKIIDFGLAAQNEPLLDAVPSVGSFTPGYVAPERYEGEQRKASADIYSLGVIAYEILTGVAPFPFELGAAMKAQEEGMFVPLRERREDIPAALAALVEQMMDRRPQQRPNAFTLASSLLPCLERNDWRELRQVGEAAYLKDDYEEAFASLERAAMIALPGERETPEYGEMVQLLVHTASRCGRVYRIAPQLVQPVFQTACAVEGHNGTLVPMETFIGSLISQPLVDPADRESAALATETIIELLLENSSSQRLGRAVTQMLKGQSHPVLWKNREDLYLVGTQYRRDGGIPVGVVEAFCIASARKCREDLGSLAEAQLWLRRVERLGVTGGADFKKERDAVESLLRNTATPIALPPTAKAQMRPGDVVGQDERSHLKIDRIVRWTERLLQLHPYVEGVKRVRKEMELPLKPTRILDAKSRSLHLKAAPPGFDENRIIPAVLDESYCIPSGTTVLRINVILAEGTTAQQRDVAVDLLRKDAYLFGEAA